MDDYPIYLTFILARSAGQEISGEALMRECAWELSCAMQGLCRFRHDIKCGILHQSYIVYACRDCMAIQKSDWRVIAI